MTSPPLQRVDAIIAGGGLAGIHLALAMDRSGLRPLVVDQQHAHSSSRVAAGIINPVTGRRFALTWMYDHLEPVFKEVYRYWEQKWDTRFFYPKNIYRSIPHNKLVNDLDIKLSEPEYQRYCRKMTDEEITSVGERIRFQAPGYVMHGFQVDTSTFLDESIHYLTEKGLYVEGRIDVSSDQVNQSQFTFWDFQSDRLIWASGAAIVDHPAFSWVRMNPNSGEILHLHSEDPELTEIIKQTAFFVPFGDRKIWLGTYDSWNIDVVKPSAEGLEYLKMKAQLLKKPYEVLDHHIAVRPAVEDRRPVVGSHPQNDQLFLFNGFGSKGTSLIPYFAQTLVDHMENGTEIHPEADLKRFW